MVTYRLADKEDYENINKFHNRIYKTERTLEQFYWEFNNCPFGKSIYVIAEDDDNIIGTNCVIPINLITSDKKIIRSGKSEDTLVDPKYRGQKIFYKIYEFLFEKCKEANIDLIWGFTSAKKPFKKLDFKIPYNHQQALAVNKIWKSYKYLTSLNPNNKIIDKIKIIGLCCLSKTKIAVKLNSYKMNYRIEKDIEVVSGVDDLISSVQSKLKESFAIHQCSDFQKWRIYENPNFHKVHTYSIYDNRNLVGLIVYNSHRNQVAYNCHSTFHSDISTNEKVKLLSQTTNMLLREGIILVRSWLFNTNKFNMEEIVVYDKAGYFHLDRGIGLVWKNLGGADLKPENFLLSRIATQGTI